VNEPEFWRRVRAGVCPECKPGHLLDNGRIWAFCGLRHLIATEEGDGFSESELARANFAPASERSEGT
jgi:hypothetical protein